MRSRTSYFNRTLFLKTVTRFWPLWFIYFVAWFIAMPLVLSANLHYPSGRHAAIVMQSNVWAGATFFGVIFGLVAACVAVMAAWSFMYSARSASGMASLPLRRECVFVSVSLGGLAPLLCVNVVIFLLCLGIQGYYGVFDAAIMGQWLAAVSLELVFFYGFALVCAQLTGNLAVLPVVYVALNFTAVLVENLVSHLTVRFVYGAGRMSDYRLAFLSPALGISRAAFATRRLEAQYSDGTYYAMTSLQIGSWGAMLAYAAVGFFLAALALWLYRRRRMESAGDVVAVNILKPVFKYCMTFGGALCVGSLLYEYLGTTRSHGQWAALALMIFFMLIGAFLGYFASEMLIHKSFRVWRGGGRWLGLGVSALVVVALMLSMELDMYGYERRVPDPERVKSVYITADSGEAKISEPENIAAAVALHRSVVENKRYYEEYDQETGYDRSDYTMVRRYMSLFINYELENGSHMSRQYYGLVYWRDDASRQTDARAAQELFNTPEAIAYRKSTAIEFTADTIFSAGVECSILPEDVEKANETTDEVYDDNGDRVAEALKYGVPVEAIDAQHSDDTARQYSANWSLTPEEAAELYNECILPDMAEGTVGTVWIITDDEYENTVYDARITIDARVLRQDGNSVYGTAPGDPNYRYEYFYTVPTVNSVRTNRWLEQHGVILRTIAETSGYIAEYGG